VTPTCEEIAPAQRTGWIEAALARIDAANAEDPNTSEWAGEPHPKEALHGVRASHWLSRLAGDASPALRLAVRAHHVERWRRPRDAYPRDRAGYLRWRRDAQRFHAERLGELVADTDVPPGVLERAQALLQKGRPGNDAEHAAEAQTFEDVLCLVFLEQQLASFAGTVDAAKLRSILAKTLPKMSADAIEHAAALPLSEAHLELLRELVAERS
jgi:hypothetical protein